ncbi:MAG: hypothetical protein A4E70_01300 [Syntrophus sp. PtaU1.Bin005]|jgi:hypothetical protein|uniref:hypothetical protein n=1 Tax=Syntrophus TaxID=43773 RepID=UPI0009CB7506|nr:MAG: hypothetical protein A4E69_00132 [Syntrophus sp. PtaB.Bin138]OPY81338.1 MAG: hypothetical protein A4E70_01300 [Syntrophus sp. PtaU1.Bin005]
MPNHDREKIKSIIAEPPASISDFMDAFDIVTDGIDYALQSFLTTEDEKAFLRRLLSRLHGDRDRLIIEHYILSSTSPGCFS